MTRYVLLAGQFVLVMTANAQTILFEEDFEGPAPGFTLNTTDVGSSAGGANTWLINAVYGGGDGLADCSGFELPFTIPATAGQPIAITSPNGNYLHTASTAAVSDGILCCSFGAADGFCTDPGNHFVRMGTDISTVGQTDVSLSFWWLCQGGTGNYGEVYYSIDAGTVWNSITTPIAQYRNQPGWVQQTISLPAFAGQPTLRFGFRFVNGITLFGAADPGFGIDDVRVLASGSVPATITTGTLPANGLCAGATFDLSFIAEGAFGPSNVFTAQLSDAGGSFAAPTSIGTLASDVSGTITCIIPEGTPAGSGYRVRVVSSDPVILGSVNGADLVITIPPFAGADATAEYCPGAVPFALFGSLGGSPDACGSWITPDGAPFNGVFQPGMDAPGVYTYTTDCPGPCPQDQATVLVVAASVQSAGADVTASICAGGGSFTPYDYINGGVTTGQFLYEGQPFPLPDFDEPGEYQLEYGVQGTSGCAADTASFAFTVIAPPEAGSGVTFTTCINGPVVDLLSLLTGADADGSWTDPSGEPFDGTLDPAVDVSGLYTYTVIGDPPCADAQSFVALVIDPCSGIQELRSDGPRITWLGVQGDMHQFQVRDEARITGVGLMDATGRLSPVLRFVQQDDRLSMDLSASVDGIYMLVFQTTAGNAVIKVVHYQR